MKIEYSERFLKDLRKLKRNPVYEAIKDYCFEDLPKYENLSSVNGVKKIQGYKKYYRIKFGDYRIGIKDEGSRIVLMRVLHRKNIYKFFP
jgi:mRNA interferase RelE/StbE